jgi:hypothetical protein
MRCIIAIMTMWLGGYKGGQREKEENRSWRHYLMSVDPKCKHTFNTLLRWYSFVSFPREGEEGEEGGGEGERGEGGRRRGEGEERGREEGGEREERGEREEGGGEREKKEREERRHVFYGNEDKMNSLLGNVEDTRKETY